MTRLFQRLGTRLYGSELVIAWNSNLEVKLGDGVLRAYAPHLLLGRAHVVVFVAVNVVSSCWL